MDFQRFSTQQQEQKGIDYREKILAFLRRHGPSVPNEVRKDIGKDNLITSAMLSELASKKLVKITHLKLGGSPLYYIPGQETQLTRFIDKVGQREREALLLLQQQKVLRDVDLAPVERVAMREIKDFAVPITVKLYGEEELFWKWFLVKNEEISAKVKELMPKPAVKEPEPEPVKEEEPVKEPEPEPVKKEEPKPKPVKKKKPGPKKVKEAVQEELPAEGIPEKVLKDRFFQELQGFCNEKGILIIEAEVIRKNAELDLVVDVPSAVGKLRYYAKAKSKKNCNDTDLAGAMIEGQSKRLPTLFLTPGKLTKKAEQKLDKELKGVVVKII